MRFTSNSTTPFPAWEIRAFDEVAICLDSQRVPITASDRIEGDYPYYGANGIQDYVSEYIFDGEYVLLAEDGGHFNDFATEPIAQYACGKIWVNNHAHILKAKCNTRFLFYSLVHTDIRNHINNPSRGKLNQDDMKKIIILLPSEEEQALIASFMTDFDKLITHEERIETVLQKYRTGLMQKVFL